MHEIPDSPTRVSLRVPAAGSAISGNIYTIEDNCMPAMWGWHPMERMARPNTEPGIPVQTTVPVLHETDFRQTTDNGMIDMHDTTPDIAQAGSDEEQKNMNNKFRLFARIIDMSRADNWDDAREEWELDYIEMAPCAEHTCLCGHYPIRELCFIRNWLTHNKALVGNCCIKHFQTMDHAGRIVDAVKENRLNDDLITYAYDRHMINDWEQGFLFDMWRKRKLTQRQRRKYEALTNQILHRVEQCYR